MTNAHRGTTIRVDHRGRASLKAAGFDEGTYSVERIDDNRFIMSRVHAYTDLELLAMRDPVVLEAHMLPVSDMVDEDDPRVI